MISAEQAKERVLRKLADYANGRISDVARGAETPRLAALLVQKYGYGLCDAFWEIYERGADGPTYHDVDAAVSEIDPDWRENGRRRWAARPADLNVLSPTESPSPCASPFLGLASQVHGSSGSVPYKKPTQLKELGGFGPCSSTMDRGRVE